MKTAVSLLSSQDTKNWKAVAARAHFDYDDENRSVEAMPTDREERDLKIDGHSIYAFIDGMVSAGPASQAGRILKSPSVIFVATSEAGQKAVLDALTAAYMAESHEIKVKKPMLYSWGGWGWVWSLVRSIRKATRLQRSADSVVLDRNSLANTALRASLSSRRAS